MIELSIIGAIKNPIDDTAEINKTYGIWLETWSKCLQWALAEAKSEALDMGDKFTPAIDPERIPEIDNTIIFSSIPETIDAIIGINIPKVAQDDPIEKDNNVDNKNEEKGISDFEKLHDEIICLINSPVDNPFLHKNVILHARINIELINVIDFIPSQAESINLSNLIFLGTKRNMDTNIASIDPKLRDKSIFAFLIISKMSVCPENAPPVWRIINKAPIISESIGIIRSQTVPFVFIFEDSDFSIEEISLPFSQETSNLFIILKFLFIKEEKIDSKTENIA